MKKLPLTKAGKNSENKVPMYRRPKIRSRRYPVKVMYLGVVANPNEEKDFDGRIYLERVSRQKTVTRASRNSRFSVDVLVNQALVDGAWKDIVREEENCTTVLDLKEKVSDMYDLDEYVASRLTFSYHTYVGANRTKKIIDLDDGKRFEELGMRTKENGEQVPILLHDIVMQVMIRSGDVVEEDVSCDSAFMLECIPKVGAALRASFHWVPEGEKIYLSMDNAGGHGTNDAIQQYTELLAADNIEIIWQVPRSPETDMLDLGVWMSI